MRLLPGPAKVPMYFVEPHVKRGDYHLFINPITGRRMWAYPRMMGERRFPVVSALGTDEQQPNVQSLIDQAFDAAQQVQQRAQEIQAQSQAVPPRAPVENAAPIHDAGMADRLFWIGLGAVGTLGLAYFLMKRGD
jgi:hypothetical protein